MAAAPKKKKTAKKAAKKPSAPKKGSPKKPSAPKKDGAKTDTPFDQLLDYALSLPEAWEDHPWGESVAKVRKKVFVFFGVEQPTKGIFICVKLPHSASEVLPEPWAEPAGYGLGKADWVYIRFEKKPTKAMLAQMRAWIEESYRAVAPKKLAKLLDAESD